MPDGSLLNPDYWIEYHSMIRILRPFVKPYHLEKVISKMNTGSNNLVSTLVGGEYRYISDFLKFCPDCVVQDEHDYGEAYWHLLHQFRGVWYCQRHGTQLFNSNINVFHRGAHRIEALTTFTGKADEQLPIIANIKPMQEITKNYLWLMDQERPFVEKRKVNDRYRVLLKHWGLMTEGGLLRIDKIYHLIHEVFPGYFLRECGFDSNPHYWIYSTISPRKKVSHPLRHIVLLVALGTNLKQFFDGEIRCCVVRESKYSLARKARILVGDREKQEKFRRFFKCVVALFPGASRTQLRKVDATGYLWLRKNDRGWFEDNMPAAKPYSLAKWKQKDMAMAQTIEKAAKTIKGMEEPVRVFTESLKRATGLSILRRTEDLARYPMTKETLSKVIETSEHFRLRKMRYKHAKLEPGEKVSRRTLRLMGGMNNGNVTPLIRSEIERLLQLSMDEVAACDQSGSPLSDFGGTYEQKATDD
jgi:hypothetical protein